MMEFICGFADYDMAEQSKRVLMSNMLEHRRYLATCQRLDRANVRQLRAYDSEMSDLRKELHRFTQAKRSMRPPDDESGRPATVPSHERIREARPARSPRSPRHKGKMVKISTGLERGKSAAAFTAKTRDESVQKLVDPSLSVTEPSKLKGLNERFNQFRSNHMEFNVGGEGSPISSGPWQRAERKIDTKKDVLQIFYNRSSGMNANEKEEALKRQTTESGLRTPTEDNIISVVADSNKALILPPPDIELPSYIKPSRLGKIEETDELVETGTTPRLSLSQQGQSGTGDFSQSVRLLRGLEWLSNKMRQTALGTGVGDEITMSSPESSKAGEVMVPTVEPSQTSDHLLPPIEPSNSSTSCVGKRSHLGTLDAGDILFCTRQQERSARANRYRVNTAALHYLEEGTFYGPDQGVGSGLGPAVATKARRTNAFGQGRHTTVRIEKRRVLRGESNLNRKPLVMK